jgi:hypothetical protein
MAFVTGDIVPSGEDDYPFKVVFKQGETVVAEWLVESQEAGEAEMIEALRSLAEFEDDDEAEEDGDEEEEGDADE